MAWDCMTEQEFVTWKTKRNRLMKEFDIEAFGLDVEGFRSTSVVASLRRPKFLPLGHRGRAERWLQNPRVEIGGGSEFAVSDTRPATPAEIAFVKEVFGL